LKNGAIDLVVGLGAENLAGAIQWEPAAHPAPA
jgi:PTS system glucose-specific IIC component